jgi:hypothetical protein
MPHIVASTLGILCAETEKYLVRSEQLLFQGGYEYKCGGDTHKIPRSGERCAHQLHELPEAKRRAKFKRRRNFSPKRAGDFQ